MNSAAEASATAATATAVAAHFNLGGPVASVEPWPGGHIHLTWRITAGGRRWVLQRINTSVFADPDAVMANLAVLAARVPSVVDARRTAGGDTLWRDDHGVWRLFPYLEGTSPPRPPHSVTTARELGLAFGAFHRDTADLDPGLLVEVIPGFHDLAGRLAALDATAAADPDSRADGCTAELIALSELRSVGGLDVDWRPPAIAARVAHFDAKPDNVLVDDETGEVRAIVDLDTAMAGSWLWDVGDLVRTAACPVVEDARDLSGVEFDVDVFAALLAGYRSCVDPWLTPAERQGLAVAPMVVTLEQAARFLTDHLAGDRYYRIARDGHNLDRARVQIRLLQSMIERRSAMISAL